MKILYFLVVVSAVVCTVWSEAELPDCSNTEDLMKCLKPIIALRDRAEFGIILSRRELDRVCPVMNRGMQCIDSYTPRCMTEEERHYYLYWNLIPTQFIEKMCRPGPFREEFLIHAPCLGQLKDDFEPCIHQNLKKNGVFLAKVFAQDSRPAGETFAENYNLHWNLCCFYRENLVCMKRIAMEKCGAKTAKYFEDATNPIYFSLNQEHCNSYPHCSDQSQDSSANRNSPRALLLPLSLAMISLYALRPT